MCGNDTRVAGYFIGMHIYVLMIKDILVTVSSAYFNIIPLDSKLYKVV